MLQTILSPFTWVKNKWLSFEAWVAAQLPGWKTHITAALAMLGDSAYFLKDYVDQLTPDMVAKFITADTMIIANMVLLTLIFWFRRLGNK